MTVDNISLLKEVEQDLKDGKKFYNQIENGVGNYFWDSLIAEIESLIIYAGIHSKW